MYFNKYVYIYTYIYLCLSLCVFLFCDLVIKSIRCVGKYTCMRVHRIRIQFLSV